MQGNRDRRFPAEWEPQDAVLLAWPHENTDWAPYLHDVRLTIATIVSAISHHENVIVLTEDEHTARHYLGECKAVSENIQFVSVPTNDIWARDFGPLFVENSGVLQGLDFMFNGWGLKFPADLDNRVSSRLFQKSVFAQGVEHQIAPMVLEGGGIESDGEGMLLSTAECLYSSNRNPHMSPEEIERNLLYLFGAERMPVLKHGALEGDDTDSHIDTLARLCPNDTIVYVSCNDPNDSHTSELHKMQDELRNLRTKHGNLYRLLPLPWPQPKFDECGKRLPATYANYLVINGAVLVPTYKDPSDEKALEVIRQAFPNREVIGIDCSILILQHGSLHCVTMQLPKGSLKK